MSAAIASSRGKGLFFPADAPKVQRPRSTSLTIVLDRLTAITPDEVGDLAPYIDVVKIGWGLPLLLRRERVRARIRLYQKEGVEVSTGGTLLEYAFAQNRVAAFLDEARALGFDLVEVSSGILELSPPQIARLADAVREHGLPYFIEVGKKDPQHQLSLKETILQIAHARTLNPRKVIVESRESGRGVGIYDSDGAIKWDWVRSILAEHPREELVFEAPQETQQVQLLRELGADVNLGNVALGSVAPLASERLGLRGETFGTVRTSRAVKGPPAAKFLYYLLQSYRGLDQSQLAQMSRMPRRTVQSALESLREQGLIQESISLHDSRRREYRLT